VDKRDLIWLQPLCQALQERRCLIRQVDLKSGETQLIPVDSFSSLTLDKQVLRQCFGPQMRMLLVGAGQLSQTLAELALAMDYEVLVTDTRQGMLDNWQGPSVQLFQGMPDDVVLAQAADRFSIVITLTHDPRIDDMALMVALESEACYVGALGSRRTTDKRKTRLKQLGISEDAIARLRAPVGLAIGSKTPMEIAVAVMAELTQLKRTAH
jgi:xanthine dehydrogenase accessory factor